MKKTLLFVLALIAAGCGPEGKDMAELADKTVRIEYNGRTIATSQYLDIETFEPYTGPVFEYDRNSCEGKVSMSAFLEDGFFQGEAHWYKCTGEVFIMNTFDRGIQHGPVEEYLFDGTTRRGSYNRQVRCGEYRAYDPCPDTED